MKICIPVKTDEGLTAKVNEHFGSAPYFLVYDTIYHIAKTLNNTDKQHAHGTCHPLNALLEQNIDIVICKGMGSRAVQALNANKIWAYRADGETAEQAIKQCEKGGLRAITTQKTCSKHNCHASSPDYNI